MEKTIRIKEGYNSLDKILEYLNSSSVTFECTKVYDRWNVRTDTNNQMEKSILIKKSSMHGMNVYFTSENTLKIMYVIPNKIMQAYFGENKEKRQNILEIITGKISQAILSGSQKKAFNEMEELFDKIVM